MNEIITPRSYQSIQLSERLQPLFRYSFHINTCRYSSTYLTLFGLYQNQNIIISKILRKPVPSYLGKIEAETTVICIVISFSTLI